MKERKWFLPICIVGGVLLLCVIGIGITVAVYKSKGYDTMEGRCLVTEDGTYILVVDNTPIKMTDRSEDKDLFEGVTTGDKIRIVHNGIAESYPAQAGVYRVTLLEDGSEEDISDAVREQLAELGWIKDTAGEEKNVDDVKQGLTESTFDAQYIRTNGGGDDIHYPIVTVIRSVKELNDYYLEYKNTFDLERKDKVYSDTTIGFLDACEKYDAAYFEEQILILVVLEEGSGSIRHEVTKVGTTDDRAFAVFVESDVPEVCTDDMAQWHIIIEHDAETAPTEESAITVFLDNRNITARRGMLCYKKGTAEIRLKELEGWEYEILDSGARDEFGCFDGETGDFGIRFWPVGHDEGSVSVYYMNFFGVCGTGLSQRMITVGGREAYEGTYDSETLWDFIHFTGDYTHFVMENRNAEAWWEEFGTEATYIIETAVLMEEKE